MLKAGAPQDLDVKQLRNEISKRNIAFTSHIAEIEQRQGRPNRKIILEFLTDRLDKLREARLSRKNRLVSIFYASSKYNLRIVFRLGDKNLYVVSYNWLLKKIKTPFRGKVPAGKKK